MKSVTQLHHRFPRYVATVTNEELTFQDQYGTGSLAQIRTWWTPADICRIWVYRDYDEIPEHSFGLGIKWDIFKQLLGYFFVHRLGMARLLPKPVLKTVFNV